MSGAGCEGCHGGTQDATLSLNVSQATPGTTQHLVFTLSDPNAKVAGAVIETDVAAQLSAGAQMATIEAGVTHTSPRSLSGGEAKFEIDWEVPSGSGVARFTFSAVAANGDGRNRGDEGAWGDFDVVYGCEPQVFYRDIDKDGHGADFKQVFCAGDAPEGFSALGDDCDDYREEIHPGAEEYCNRKDDDCDGEIDEDALPVELYPDADGDGYSSADEVASGETVVGCLPYEGYADQVGDCDGDDPTVNPGAEEVCDYYTDEDCDGRIDERVRPQCGEGWCRRESSSCDLEDCFPGDPIEETCNFFDDDCDGEIDEGALCPGGEECVAGECRVPQSVAPGDDAPVADPQLPPDVVESGEPPLSPREPTESAGCAVTSRSQGLSRLAFLFFTLAVAGLTMLRRFAPKGW